MSDSRKRLSYVLVTPARNEEAFIEDTIRSVVSQSVPPRRWVIVNDGSTDRTREIAQAYADRHDWIEVVDMTAGEERSFASKAYGFNEGCRRLEHFDYDLLGNLDADISLSPRLFEFLLERFQEDDRLGVAGPTFREEDGYDSSADSFEGERHVAGGCQVFRRQCLEALGGYVPHKAGGVDWIAVTTARMLGWKTRSFRQQGAFHHRSLGTAGRGTLASRFCYGEKDYCLGNHPLWECFRVLYQFGQPPFLVGGLAIGLGYLRASIGRPERPVSQQLMRFHRAEQMQKLKAIFKSLIRLRSPDRFHALTDEAARGNETA